jgi:C4-dicarboxylate-specific signal transduction histidine kinase
VLYSRYQFQTLVEKTAEHQQRLLSLGEMAAFIGHEIKNSLAIIGGKATVLSASLQQKTPSTSEKQEQNLHIDAIHKQVNRIDKIIRNLSSMAHFNNVPEEANVLPVDELIRETIYLCQFRIAKAGVKLHYTAVDTSLGVRGNDAQLTQVLLNLFFNAIDAVAECNEKWLKIAARRIDDGHVKSALVEISVTDSGPGVKSSASAIFEPFFTTKSKGHGTGIGLAVSRRIIEHHGGRLILDQASAHTKFIILLPFVRINPGKENSTAELSQA